MRAHHLLPEECEIYLLCWLPKGSPAFHTGCPSFIPWPSPFISKRCSHDNCANVPLNSATKKKSLQPYILQGNKNSNSGRTELALKATAVKDSFHGYPASFHITCFGVLQSHFFFCVFCLWGWPDSLESARSPIVLLGRAVVRAFGLRGTIDRP